jgi:thioredoxin 1
MAKIEFTDQNFEQEVLKADVPVVIDFWAIWCGPCKLIAPIMDELSEQYGDKAKIGKLDVDVNQQTAIKYGVRSIPTVLFFKDGEVKDIVIGAVNKQVFVQKLENLLD